ncbi:hypothetical protein SAMN05443550_101157 [Pedobacter hartonius]|uniref:Uncharacterized protein n=1 Tax=Pedobacter hartonius TaxID=425514 RepID=A0A1H3WBI8_9SPHI|nr:hypothetical protein SAMN05443550_101157 [Pedobacter hartonius]
MEMPAIAGLSWQICFTNSHLNHKSVDLKYHSAQLVFNQKNRP